MKIDVPNFLTTNYAGIYYYRRRVPVGLRRHVGKNEIRRSLKTRDQRTATEQARIMNIIFEAQLEDLKKEYGMSGRRDNRIEHKTEMLTRIIQRHNPDGTYEEVVEFETEDHEDPEDSVDAALYLKEKLQRQREEAKVVQGNHLSRMQQRHAEHQHNKLETDVIQIESEGTEALSSPPTQQQSSGANELSEPKNAIKPTSAHTSSAQRQNKAPKPRTRKKRRSTIHEVYTEFCKVKEASEWGSPKTARSYRRAAELFMTIFGSNVVMNDFGTDDARNFLKVLHFLPSGVKLSEIEGQTIKELERRTWKRKQLSLKGKHDLLNKLKALFQFAMEEKFAHENIFRNIKSGYKRDNTVGSARKSMAPRAHFSSEELYTLFGNRNFPAVVHHNKYDKRLSKSGNEATYSPMLLVRKPKIPLNPIDTIWWSHHWAPLIALHTGMRRSEIFFLTCKKVRKIDEIWCFDIVEERENAALAFRKERKQEKHQEESQTKTGRSRIVPVHPKLIELGLLDYVAWRSTLTTNGKARLFPEYADYEGQAGNKFTEWFSSYKIYKCGITAKNKVYHCFRNTFICKMESKEAYTPKLNAITGHSTTKTSDGKQDSAIARMTYGGSFAPSDLLEIMKLIDFSDVLQDVKPWKELRKDVEEYNETLILDRRIEMKKNRVPFR